MIKISLKIYCFGLLLSGIALSQELPTVSNFYFSNGNRLEFHLTSNDINLVLKETNETQKISSRPITLPLNESEEASAIKKDFDSNIEQVAYLKPEEYANVYKTGLRRIDIAPHDSTWIFFETLSTLYVVHESGKYIALPIDNELQKYRATESEISKRRPYYPLNLFADYHKDNLLTVILKPNSALGLTYQKIYNFNFDPNVQEIQYSSPSLNDSKTSEQIAIELDAIPVPHKSLLFSERETADITANVKEGTDTKSIAIILKTMGAKINSVIYENRSLPEISPNDPRIRQIVNTLTLPRIAGPVVTGESGEGKSTIVYAFIKMVKEGRIPEIPATTLFIQIDAFSLDQGSTFRGSGEDRFAAIINFAKNKQVILFIDEIHSALNAGTHSNSDVGYIKSAKEELTGAVKMIGTTTYDEYNKYIASDGALARRLPASALPKMSKKDVLEAIHFVGLKNYNFSLSPQLAENIIAFIERFGRGPTLISESTEVLDYLLKEAAKNKETPNRWSSEELFSKIGSYLQVPKIFLNNQDKVNFLKSFMAKIDQKHFGDNTLKNELMLHIYARLQGLETSDKPAARWLLTGTAGAGKTTLPEHYAEMLGVPFIKVPMQSFQSADAVYQFLGAQLKNPYSVIVFDELDKVKFDGAIDALLNILDSPSFSYEPRVQSSTAPQSIRKITTRHATVFLTANAGLKLISQKGRVGFKSSTTVNETPDWTQPEFQQSLRDEIVTTSPISEYILDRCSYLIPMEGVDSPEKLKAILSIHFDRALKEIQATNPTQDLSEDIKEEIISKVVRQTYSETSGPMTRMAIEAVKKEIKLALLSRCTDLL